MSGDFVVSYQGRDDGFGTAARRAASQIRAIGEEAAVAAKGQLASLKGSLLAIASAGYLKHQIDQSIEFADQLVKLSAQTKLSTDSLQEIGFAAKQSSVSMESVASAIKIMEKSRVEAIRGNKQLVDSFSRLGVSLDDLKTMNVDRLFRTIAEAIHNGTYSATQLSDSLKILGRGATQIFPLFEDGLAEMSARAREANVIIGQDMIENLDRLGDQMDEVAGRFRVGFAMIGDAASIAWNSIARGVQISVGWITAVVVGWGRAKDALDRIVSEKGWMAAKEAFPGAVAGVFRDAAQSAREEMDRLDLSDKARIKKGGTGIQADSAAERQDKADVLRLENVKKENDILMKSLPVRERIAKLAEEQSFYAEQMVMALDELDFQESLKAYLDVRASLQAAREEAKRPGKKGESQAGLTRNLDELSRSGFFTGGAPLRLAEINKQQLDELKKHSGLLQRLPSDIAGAL